MATRIGQELENALHPTIRTQFSVGHQPELTHQRRHVRNHTPHERFRITYRRRHHTDPEARLDERPLNDVTFSDDGEVILSQVEAQWPIRVDQQVTTIERNKVGTRECLDIVGVSER